MFGPINSALLSRFCQTDHGGLRHEERRYQYLSAQAKIMTTFHDDIATLPEDSIDTNVCEAVSLF